MPITQPPISDSHIELRPSQTIARPRGSLTKRLRRRFRAFNSTCSAAIDLLGIRSEIQDGGRNARSLKSARRRLCPISSRSFHMSIENATVIYVTYEGEQVVNGR